MNLLLVSTCILLTVTSGIIAEDPESFQQCFEKDSISCVQMAAFRTAKSFFDKPNIDLFAGLSLVKNAENRQGKSLEDNTIAIETAKSVQGRNNEIESYLFTNAKQFFQERSLNFNFMNAARSVARAIPDDIKTDIRELVVEGRGKKKKLLKKLLPILIGVAAKFALLGLLSLFGLLFMAKKALLISVLALGLAAFTGITSVIKSKVSSVAGASGGLFGGLGSLFGGGGSSGGYSNGGGGWASSGGGGSGGGGWPSSGGGWSAGGGGGGWSAGGGGGGWDSHGSYSSPVAQTIAYSGHKAARRSIN